MCNRFVNSASGREIAALAEALGFDPPFPDGADAFAAAEYFPDSDVPVLRPTADGRLDCVPLRWGLPPPPGVKAPVTNIRRLGSRWWREENVRWILPAQFRCLVPFTAFAEPARRSTWFSLPDGAPACFAGIWHPWRGMRLATRPGHARRVRTLADWNLFAILTTDANALVRPVHPQAMPVVLRRPADMKSWLAGGEGSFRLQRPLPDVALRVCAPPDCAATPEPAQRALPL